MTSLPADLVVETEVRRQEDGFVLTLRFADGRVREQHLSPAELVDLKNQMDRIMGIV
jgi:hypothetical protein